MKSTEEYMKEALKLNEEHLVEMAYRRSDAIKVCLDLGFEFINHFHKVMQEGKTGIDFEHHCKEMDTWWRKVRDIKLKHNNKILSDEQLVDWFFTAGSGVDIKIKEPYQGVYKQLYEELLQNRINSDVLSIMNKLI